MSIVRYHRKEKFSDLLGRFPVFEKFSGAVIKYNGHNFWVEKKSQKTSHDFMIAFFGKSGYGKSSTVNAFFGRDIMETSDVEACTRRCNCLGYEISDGNYLSIGDFPGIGESEYRDKEYLKMYGDFMDSVGVVVYVMRADARDHSIDEKAYDAIFKSAKNRDKVIIAINQCDKVEPVSRGKWEAPTIEQMKNIQEKIKFLQEKFQPRHKIIPYSASTSWNMNALAAEIVKATIDSGCIKKSRFI